MRRAIATIPLPTEATNHMADDLARGDFFDYEEKWKCKLLPVPDPVEVPFRHY